MDFSLKKIHFICNEGKITNNEDLPAITNDFFFHLLSLASDPYKHGASKKGKMERKEKLMKKEKHFYNLWSQHVRKKGTKTRESIH